MVWLIMQLWLMKVCSVVFVHAWIYSLAGAVILYHSCIFTDWFDWLRCSPKHFIHWVLVIFSSGNDLNILLCALKKPHLIILIYCIWIYEHSVTRKFVADLSCAEKEPIIQSYAPCYDKYPHHHNKMQKRKCKLRSFHPRKQTTWVNLVCV